MVVDFPTRIESENIGAYEFVREIMQQIGLENPEDNILRKRTDYDHICVPENLREHIEMIRTVRSQFNVGNTNNFRITAEKVRKYINKLKCGSQPGLDGIKPEIYKWLSLSHECIGPSLRL